MAITRTLWHFTPSPQNTVGDSWSWTFSTTCSGCEVEWRFIHGPGSTLGSMVGWWFHCMCLLRQISIFVRISFIFALFGHVRAITDWNRLHGSETLKTNLDGRISSVSKSMGPFFRNSGRTMFFFAVAYRWGASIIGIEILRNPNLAKIFDIGIQNVHVQWPTPKFPVPRNDVPQMLKSGDFDGVRSKHRIGTHFQIILVLATQWVVTFWGLPSKIIVWASNLGFYMV